MKTTKRKFVLILVLVFFWSLFVFILYKQGVTFFSVALGVDDLWRDFSKGEKIRVLSSLIMAVSAIFAAVSAFSSARSSNISKRSFEENREVLSLEKYNILVKEVYELHLSVQKRLAKTLLFCKYLSYFMELFQSFGGNPKQLAILLSMRPEWDRLYKKLVCRLFFDDKNEYFFELKEFLIKLDQIRKDVKNISVRNDRKIDEKKSEKEKILNELNELEIECYANSKECEKHNNHIKDIEKFNLLFREKVKYKTTLANVKIMAFEDTMSQLYAYKSQEQIYALEIERAEEFVKMYGIDKLIAKAIDFEKKSK